jgi:hypothetical protein
MGMFPITRAAEFGAGGLPRVAIDAGADCPIDS